jgi:hypothetical protein
MAELNGTAAFEVEFLQAVREDAYDRGYIMGVYSLLLAIANEGTEAALKSAEEFVFKLMIRDKELADKLEKELVSARARKNDN